MFNMEENELNYLQKAYELCDQKEYELAKTIFAKYLKINENDYHANLGMVRALTHDYSKENVAEDFEFYFQKALAVAPIQEKSKILKKYNTYEKKLKLINEVKIKNNETKIEKLLSNYDIYFYLIGVFIIFIIAMNYASKKIKKENILEALREENI